MRADILRPRIGLGQQHLAGEVRVEPCPQLLQHHMHPRQIFAGCPFPLDEVGNSVHAKPIHAEVEPEHMTFRFLPLRLGCGDCIVRLVAEEAMPVVGF